MGNHDHKDHGVTFVSKGSFLVTLAMAALAAIAFFFGLHPKGMTQAFGVGSAVSQVKEKKIASKGRLIDMTQARVVVNPGGVKFSAPKPGTYDLAKVDTAVDGKVVDVMGHDDTLFNVIGDRVGLVSFIYTYCGDEKGCPLAVSSFYELEDMIKDSPALKDKVKMVTLSFDPQNDTPEAMADFANIHASDTVDHSLHFHTLEARYGTEQALEMEKVLGDDAICKVAVQDRSTGKWQVQVGTTDQLWTFLTTRSETDLAPILDGYHQYIIKDIDEDGELTGSFSHVLKVFLVDQNHNVRNIYSTSFLYPELVLNDIETLLMEDKQHAQN